MKKPNYKNKKDEVNEYENKEIKNQNDLIIEQESIKGKEIIGNVEEKNVIKKLDHYNHKSETNINFDKLKGVKSILNSVKEESIRKKIYPNSQLVDVKDHGYNDQTGKLNVNSFEGSDMKLQDKELSHLKDFLGYECSPKVISNFDINNNDPLSKKGLFLAKLRVSMSCDKVMSMPNNKKTIKINNLSRNLRNTNNNETLSSNCSIREKHNEFDSYNAYSTINSEDINNLQNVRIDHKDRILIEKRNQSSNLNEKSHANNIMNLNNHQNYNPNMHYAVNHLNNFNYYIPYQYHNHNIMPVFNNSNVIIQHNENVQNQNSNNEIILRNFQTYNDLNQKSLPEIKNPWQNLNPNPKIQISTEKKSLISKMQQSNIISTDTKLNIDLINKNAQDQDQLKTNDFKLEEDVNNDPNVSINIDENVNENQQNINLAENIKDLNENYYINENTQVPFYDNNLNINYDNQMIGNEQVINNDFVKNPYFPYQIPIQMQMNENQNQYIEYPNNEMNTIGGLLSINNKSSKKRNFVYNSDYNQVSDRENIADPILMNLNVNGYFAIYNNKCCKLSDFLNRKNKEIRICNLPTELKDDVKKDLNSIETIDSANNQIDEKEKIKTLKQIKKSRRMRSIDLNFNNNNLNINKAKEATSYVIKRLDKNKSKLDNQPLNEDLKKIKEKDHTYHKNMDREKLIKISTSTTRGGSISIKDRLEVYKKFKKDKKNPIIRNLKTIKIGNLDESNENVSKSAMIIQKFIKSRHYKKQISAIKIQSHFRKYILRKSYSEYLMVFYRMKNSFLFLDGFIKKKFFMNFFVNFVGGKKNYDDLKRVKCAILLQRAMKKHFILKSVNKSLNESIEVNVKPKFLKSQLILESVESIEYHSYPEKLTTNKFNESVITNSTFHDDLQSNFNKNEFNDNSVIEKVDSNDKDLTIDNNDNNGDKNDQIKIQKPEKKVLRVAKRNKKDDNNEINVKEEENNKDKKNIVKNDMKNDNLSQDLNSNIINNQVNKIELTNSSHNYISNKPESSFNFKSIENFDVLIVKEIQTRNKSQDENIELENISHNYISTKPESSFIKKSIENFDISIDKIPKKDYQIELENSSHNYISTKPESSFIKKSVENFDISIDKIPKKDYQIELENSSHNYISTKPESSFVKKSVENFDISIDKIPKKEYQIELENSSHNYISTKPESSFIKKSIENFDISIDKIVKQDDHVKIENTNINNINIKPESSFIFKSIENFELTIEKNTKRDSQIELENSHNNYISTKKESSFINRSIENFDISIDRVIQTKKETNVELQNSFHNYISTKPESSFNKKSIENFEMSIDKNTNNNKQHMNIELTNSHDYFSTKPESSFKNIMIISDNFNTIHGARMNDKTFSLEANNENFEIISNLIKNQNDVIKTVAINQINSFDLSYNFKPVKKIYSEDDIVGFNINIFSDENYKNKIINDFLTSKLKNNGSYKSIKNNQVIFDLIKNNNSNCSTDIEEDITIDDTKNSFEIINHKKEENLILSMADTFEVINIKKSEIIDNEDNTYNEDNESKKTDINQKLSSQIMNIVDDKKESIFVINKSKPLRINSLKNDFYITKKINLNKNNIMMNKTVKTLQNKFRNRRNNNENDVNISKLPEELKSENFFHNYLSDNSKLFNNLSIQSPLEELFFKNEEKINNIQNLEEKNETNENKDQSEMINEQALDKKSILEPIKALKVKTRNNVNNSNNAYDEPNKDIVNKVIYQKSDFRNPVKRYISNENCYFSKKINPNFKKISNFFVLLQRNYRINRMEKLNKDFYNKSRNGTGNIYNTNNLSAVTSYEKSANLTNDPNEYNLIMKKKCVNYFITEKVIKLDLDLKSKKITKLLRKNLLVNNLKKQMAEMKNKLPKTYAKISNNLALRTSNKILQNSLRLWFNKLKNEESSEPIIEYISNPAEILTPKSKFANKISLKSGNRVIIQPIKPTVKNVNIISFTKEEVKRNPDYFRLIFNTKILPVFRKLKEKVNLKMKKNKIFTKLFNYNRRKDNLSRWFSKWRTGNFGDLLESYENLKNEEILRKQKEIEEIKKNSTVKVFLPKYVKANMSNSICTKELSLNLNSQAMKISKVIETNYVKKLSNLKNIKKGGKFLKNHVIMKILPLINLAMTKKKLGNKIKYIFYKNDLSNENFNNLIKKQNLKLWKLKSDKLRQEEENIKDANENLLNRISKNINGLMMKRLFENMKNKMQKTLELKKLIRMVYEKNGKNVQFNNKLNLTHYLLLWNLKSNQIAINHEKNSILNEKNDIEAKLKEDNLETKSKYDELLSKNEDLESKLLNEKKLVNDAIFKKTFVKFSLLNDKIEKINLYHYLFLWKSNNDKLAEEEKKEFLINEKNKIENELNLINEDLRNKHEDLNFKKEDLNKKLNELNQELSEIRENNLETKSKYDELLSKNEDLESKLLNEKKLVNDAIFKKTFVKFCLLNDKIEKINLYHYLFLWKSNKDKLAEEEKKEFLINEKNKIENELNLINADLKNKNEDFDMKKDELNKRLNELNQELSDIKATSEILTSELKNKNEDFDMKKDELNKRLNELNQELSDIKATSEILASELKNKNEDIINKDNEICGIKQNLEKVEEEKKIMLLEKKKRLEEIENLHLFNETFEINRDEEMLKEKNDYLISTTKKSLNQQFLRKKDDVRELIDRSFMITVKEIENEIPAFVFSENVTSSYLINSTSDQNNKEEEIKSSLDKEKNNKLLSENKGGVLLMKNIKIRKIDNLDSKDIENSKKNLMIGLLKKNIKENN
jgi:hypothetical protein